MEGRESEECEVKNTSGREVWKTWLLINHSWVGRGDDESLLIWKRRLVLPPRVCFPHICIVVHRKPRGFSEVAPEMQKSQSFGLNMNHTSSVAESRTHSSVTDILSSFFFFCILLAWERPHLMLPLRIIYMQTPPPMNTLINQLHLTCQAPEPLPTRPIQSVKVIHHCDWEDNKHVLPSCIRTQCVAAHYQVSTQACNCVIAAELRRRSVLCAL